MSQDFVIPVSRDDLLVESRSAYYVRRMHLPSAIAARLEEANEALSSAGYLSITAHFDTLFSALSHFAELDQPTKRKAWKTTIKWLESLCSSLGAMLDQEDMSYQEKKRHCTAIKMLCYLTTQFIETFMKPASMTIATQKKRGRKTTTNGGNVASWDEARDRGLHCIEQMLEMDLKRLWDPPILEENFVTCVTSCCYKLLENSETVRKRGAKELIFHILGIAISKCNHCMGATLKIIQLLQDFEHLCIPLAEAVEYFGRQLEAKTIVVELIREIGSLDPQDMSRDTSGTRALATFVAEIGERLPDIVLSIISSLLPHLDGENYSLRNSVLVTIGAIVAQVLSEPSVDDVAKATRDEFLDKLMEHIYDVNAFVRSKCLQVWLNLFKKQAIPLATQQCLVPKIVDRLQDKSSNVRKYSIQFLTTFLCGNPFAHKLSYEQVKKDLEEAQSVLTSLTAQPEDSEKENETDSEENSPELIPSENTDQIAKQRQLVTYLKDTLNFILNVEKAVPTVSFLLNSKTVTDILEAMNFFITCHEFGIEAAKIGVRKMIVLVWSKETAVKEAIANAFKRLYLTNKSPSSAAHQLMSLTENLTVGEMKALEELVRLLVASKDISRDVVQQLWKTFASRTESSVRRRGAIILLGMAASAEADVVKSNLDVVVSSGFEKDLEIAKYSCIALEKIASLKKTELSLRFPSRHFLFEKLTHALLESFENEEAEDWAAFGCHAIKTIYKLCEQPDQLCGNLLKAMVKKMIESGEEENENDKEVEGENTVSDAIDVGEPLAQSTQDPSCDCATTPTPPLLCSSLIMTRFLAIAGQIGVSELVHVDTAIAREIKRRTGARLSVKEKAPPPSTTASKRRSSHMASIESEMGMDQAAVEDQEAEMLRQICESEIVTGSGLLGVLRPFVISICGQPSRFPDRRLQAAAAMTLGKFMLVSSEFCASHLQLFFTILQKSSDPTVRANSMIAVSDLAIRFPNLIEPWTPHLYSRLKDDSVQVRKTTMLVLSRLILNDMIKVKGQISEMAFCLEDENPAIRKLAKLFFHDLSQKGNALYNVLPDIISHLSDPDRPTTQSKYSSIMKYLISFIQKERQSETLIEKLCHRFKTTQTDRQACDLSLCLAQLSFSEKGLRKLQENIPCYQEYLRVEEVYTNFMSMLNKAKKFAKQDSKALIDELETRMDEIHAKGVEQDETAQKAAQASKKATKRKKADRKPKDFCPDDGDDDDFERGPVRRKAPKPRKNRRVLKEIDEADFSDLELFELSDDEENAENVHPKVH